MENSDIIIKSIYCKDPYEFIETQKILFKLGYIWGDGDKNVLKLPEIFNYLYINLYKDKKFRYIIKPKKIVNPADYISFNDFKEKYKELYEAEIFLNKLFNDQYLNLNI